MEIQLNKLYYINLFKKIINFTIETHKKVNLDSNKNVFIQHLIHKLKENKLSFNLEINLPYVNRIISNSEESINNLIIDNKIILGLITEENILPIHESRLLNSMKSLQIELGLVINYKKILLNDGIRILIYQDNKDQLSENLFKSLKKEG